jgi:hypothetical protein
MKVTSNYPPKPKKRSFPDKMPALVVFHDPENTRMGKLVVWATGPVSGHPDAFTGIVVQGSDDGNMPVGHYTDLWARSSFMEAPDDIEITISNS